MLLEKVNNNEFSFIFIKVDAGENFGEEIKDFSNNRKVMFFSANEFGKQRNLNRLYKEMVMAFEHTETDKKRVSIEDVCSYIEEKGNKEQVMWVIDNVEDILNNLFSNPDKMQEMKIHARLISKKNSTRDICKILLG